MSTFQNLPYLIIKKIFSYAVCDSSDNVKSFKTTFAPFAGLSQIWRHLGLQYILGVYRMTIARNRITRGIRGWPADLDLPVASLDPWVKTLKVTFNCPIVNPAAVQSSDGMASFGSAHTLEIFVHHMEFRKKRLRVVKEIVPRFVKYLQDLAPNVTDVKIFHKGYSTAMNDKEYRDIYISLMRLLLSRFTKRKMVLHCIYIFGLDIGDISDSLSEIILLDFSGNSQLEIVELVRKCSKTLQIFEVGGSGTEIALFNMLTNGDAAESMVYPRLKYLKFEFTRHGLYNGPYPSFPDAVPFPNLQRIVQVDIYPFGDDVLFRGSQHTLRSVKLVLTPNLATQLIDNHTFSSANSYDNLENVEVSTFTNGPSLNDSSILQLVSEIGRNAKVLRFQCHYECESIGIECIKESLSSPTLQVPSLETSGLTFVNIAELIQQFPRLAALECTAKLIEDLPNSLAPLECVEHLVKTYYPLSKRLTVFCFNHKCSGWTRNTIRLLLFLAILCPSLEQIIIAYKWDPDYFLETWDKMINLEMYSEYADRLKSVAIRKGLIN